MTIVLGTIGPSILATAEADGWWLRPAPGVRADLSQRASWPDSAFAEPGGVGASLQTEGLLDLELAEVDAGSVVVRWERFGDLFKEDIQLPFRWTSWSPLMLSIDRVSEIGRADFRYRYAYCLGSRESDVDRVGFFIQRKVTGQVFHLDAQTFALVDAMDRFNDLPGGARGPEMAWLTFATVKGCSTAVGAELDAYLASNDVIVPSQIALDIITHEDESISFVPKIGGPHESGFCEAFLRNADAHGMYVLDGEDGRRVRIVLSEPHRQVLERMKRVRRARGTARIQAQSNPAQVFDGLLDSIEIHYGPRVIGIGEFPFSSAPAASSGGVGFLDSADRSTSTPDGARPKGDKDRPTMITIPAPGGKDVRLLLKNRRAVAEARLAVADAIERGVATVLVQGTEIAATSDTLEALGTEPIESKDGAERAGGRRFLLVYTNEADLRTSDADAAARASQIPPQLPSEAQLPTNIRAGIKLKPHQMDSLLWLQRCAVVPDRRGVLLADDMGLGKTLQILTFLAWRIETGHLRWSARGGDGPPWRPILIVAPLILVDNETWVSEMRTFFAHDGDLFQPLLVLHGSGIDAVRDGRSRGGETVIGRPLLAVEKLMQYRTIITNYETVVSYQHSLAQLKDGRTIWSAIVTDEAQQYKGMNTKKAMALKAISCDFHVASTGTPVENRLLDLWNILDTIQPAALGPATGFTLNYEHRLGGEEETVALADLRRRLLFGQPHAYILRRTKEDVADLPRKNVALLRCEMSPEERSLHAELLGALSHERPLGRHLAVLQRLAQLYQHPALLRGDWDRRPPAELIAESSKLKAVIKQLHRISSRGEKVIIFARNHDAQQLLARVIGTEFSTDVPIINGATSRARGYSHSSAASARAKNERKRILDGFRGKPGFAAIILSPFVAGIGLTITEANHVVHYGRWWNPAVEAQATDRAYRIGQTREVTVYLPVLHDPTGQIVRSFDECMEHLLARKAALAKDFLHPATEEAQNASELCSMLSQDGEGLAELATPFTLADLDRLDPADFEAAVGALYRALGFLVVLTAKGGDGGADVLAFKPGHAVLVQTKHSATRSPVDQRALSDVTAAIDVYSGRRGLDWKGVVWKAVLASNAPIAAETVREAEHVGIDTIAGDRLARMMAEARVGMGAAAACAAARCASFNDGLRQAQAYVMQ